MNNNDNWIKCSDRLPEKDQAVIVYTKDGETFIANFLNATVFDIHARVLNGFRSADKITHWQPLPEPPKTNQ